RKKKWPKTVIMKRKETSRKTNRRKTVLKKEKTTNKKIMSLGKTATISFEKVCVYIYHYYCFICYFRICAGCTNIVWCSIYSVCWRRHSILVHPAEIRSEEHTSELQSRFDLVCRLLLEKKKRNNIYCI